MVNAAVGAQAAAAGPAHASACALHCRPAAHTVAATALAGCELEGSPLALPEPEALGQGSGEAVGLREKEGEALLLGPTE